MDVVFKGSDVPTRITELAIMARCSTGGSTK